MIMVYVCLKATDVILSMTVKIIVMKKDVVYTVRLTIIVSLYPHCLPIIHMFKCCPSYCYMLGERKKIKINHAPVYLKKVIGYTALPFFLQ